MSRCRICNRELEDETICPTCGRMVVHYPDVLPEVLQQYLNEEKAHYEQHNNSEQETQQALREKERVIKELNRTIDELQKTITKKGNLIESLNEKLQEKDDYIAYWICPKCKIPYQVGANCCTKCGHERPNYQVLSN